RKFASAGAQWPPFARVRQAKTSAQPRKLLIRHRRLADDAEKYLLEGELLAGNGRSRGDLRRLRLDSGAELLERPLRDQTPAMNDRDVAAKAFDDLEDVRREENRRTARNHALKHGLQEA